MDSADKLIEYYFHRKIAGMSSADIYKSLKQQMLEEEEREIIVSQVEHKEILYLKTLRQKKMARILAISSATLLLITVSVFAYISASGSTIINPIIIYLVFAIGALVAFGSFLLFPKKQKVIFRH